MLGPDPNKKYPITLDLNFFELQTLREAVQLQTLREAVQRQGGPGLQIKFDAAVHDTDWLADWNEYPDVRRSTDKRLAESPPENNRLANFVMFLLIAAQLSFGFWVFFM